MTTIRALIAVVLFIVGSVLLFVIVQEGWNFKVCLAAITAFFAAYFIWPSKRKGERLGDHLLLDILELFIEFPIQLLSWSLRAIRKLFRNDDGIDIGF
ncbi:hypothetical protein [Teredinibacter haidensis]|uniref:hypothetical protein n=1 Tax=Teredinibacter haidensis TaxID=2731755 RepID=UPI00094902A5|nr:hypothetical protein [Teredinibacter haidensis]